MSNPSSLYYILQIAVPATLIVSGWFVLYRNSVKIESRKEARDFVEQISILIEKINIDVQKYYSVDNSESIGNLSCTIKSNFLLLSHYLFIMKGLGIDFQNSDHLVGFKKITTGGYFETHDYLKQINVPGWQTECSNHAAQLKLSIRMAYFLWCGSFKTSKESAFRKRNN